MNANEGDVLEWSGTGEQVKIVGVELSRHRTERNLVSTAASAIPTASSRRRRPMNDASERAKRASTTGRSSGRGANHERGFFADPRGDRS